MIYYFAYGMNTNLAQMAQRCPKAKLIGPATLDGHRFRFAGCADIIADEGNYVDGVLWLCTEECMMALDILEGYPRFYNCKEVLVVCDGVEYRAEVYYMNPGNDDGLPSNHYLDMVTEGYMDNNVPLDQITVALEELQENNNRLTEDLY